jgi:hypothetical protein
MSSSRKRPTACAPRRPAPRARRHKSAARRAGRAAPGSHAAAERWAVRLARGLDCKGCSITRPQETFLRAGCIQERKDHVGLAAPPPTPTKARDLSSEPALRGQVSGSRTGPEPGRSRGRLPPRSGPKP